MATGKPRFNVGDTVKRTHKNGVLRWRVMSRTLVGMDWHYAVEDANGRHQYFNRLLDECVLDKERDRRPLGEILKEAEQNEPTPAGKWPPPPLEPLGKAPEVCRYLQNMKVGTVEPIAERFYGGVTALLEEERRSLAARMVQKTQRNLREVPVCNVTGQPIRIGAVVNPNGDDGKYAAMAILYCPACNKADAEYRGELE